MRPTIRISVDETKEEFVIDAAQEVPAKWTPFTVLDGTQVSTPDIAPDVDVFDSAEDYDAWEDDGGHTATPEEEEEIDEILAEAGERDATPEEATEIDEIVEAKAAKPKAKGTKSTKGKS